MIESSLIHLWQTVLMQRLSINLPIEKAIEEADAAVEALSKTLGIVKMPKTVTD